MSFAPAVPTSETRLWGKLHGGQQPVSNASIQLYTAATGAAGSASTPLLANGIMSDSNGNFDIPGPINCPSSSMQLYLTATGGNPGLANNPNNTALLLMTAIGSCGTLSNSTFLNVDEITTVAAAFALQPYMTDQTHVSSTSANSAALAQAFTIASELADSATGTAGGPSLPAGSYVPALKINTFANVLSICVNSTGSVASGQPCNTLFSATSAPLSSNTLLAALKVAGSVSTNVGSIFALAPPASPFQPVLTTAPSDWSMKVETLSWPNPNSITYGTALGATQLNATATVPGTFAYSPAAGKVPTTSETLSVIFTPTDTAAYSIISASVPLTVTPTPATIALVTSVYFVNETDGSVTLSVTRANDPNGVVSVAYATSNGTGAAGTAYTATSGTLTWGDQDLHPKTINIPILNPGLSNTSQTFSVTLSGVSGPGILGTAMATVTVLDGIPNPAGTISWSASHFAANETTNIVTISAVRTGGSNGSVQASWTTMDGTATQVVDYSQSSSFFNWSNGDTSTKSVNISIANPGVYGGTRTFYMVFSNPTGGVTIGTPASTSVDIADNLTNAAGAIQFEQAIYNTTESSGSVLLGLTRTTGSTGAVSATVINRSGTAQTGTDYTAKTLTVNWASGDDTSTQYISIPILDAHVVGGTRYFFANLSVAGGAVKGNPSQAVISISDNDSSSTLSQLQITAPSWVVQENGGAAVIHISRLGNAASAATAHYAMTAGTAVAGTDFTSSTGTLSWAANDSADKLITIPVADQHIDGGFTRSFTVAISAPSGAVLGAQATAVVNIAENDTGHGTVSFITPAFTIPENSQYIKLLVQRTIDMTGPASIQYATGDGSAHAGVDYTPTNGTLTWADGDNIAKVIEVPIIDANVTNGQTRTLTVRLTNPSGATLGPNATSTVNIIDNDMAANFCANPASNPKLGTPPVTSCNGLTLAGTTAANGFAQCSANFSTASASSFLVGGAGVATSAGTSDFFFGQLGTTYNFSIPAAANLSVANDNGVIYPCSPTASESIGGVPFNSEGNTPYFELIAISAGNVLNYGTLNTYPLNSSTANNYKPTSAVIYSDNTNPSDQITNFGSIGDYYTNANMSNISSGYGTYNSANPNSLTLGYAQETFAAIDMNVGTITNAPGAFLRGDNTVFTMNTPGTFNNYGTDVANNDGYLGSWTLNNYDNAGMGLNRNAYDAAHNSGTTNNWGYMISGDFGVEMGGTNTILNTYGGPAVPGAVDFDGNPVYGGEIISIQSYVSCSVQMDSSNQQVNLTSRNVAGNTYLPIIVGPMCGSYSTTTATPMLNILNFNFTGLSQSEYDTLTAAISASLVAGPYGNYYTGSVTLRGHLYRWLNYGYVNFTGIPPS